MWSMEAVFRPTIPMHGKMDTRHVYFMLNFRLDTH